MSEPESLLVRYEASNGAAVLTLDSPHNRNALSDRLVADLLGGLNRADEDHDVRVVVLTHTGSTFCAGADLSAATSVGSGDVEAARARGEQLLGVLRRMVTFDKPVVGRIDGHVRAGGMGLVGACDIVVARSTATFALTESRLGLAASVISVILLPRLAPRQAARLFLTGETVDGTEAARIGVVTEAVQDTGAAVEAMMASLRKASPQGLRESKALVNHSLVADLDVAAERVLGLSARLFASDEAREGMVAFLERRPPRWVS
jgi:enoyl-CoA hydratase